jgi:hypothetical protein
MPLVITINACVVTAVSISTYMLTGLNYTIGSSAVTVSFATYAMTPACEYAFTYSYEINGVAGASQPWFTFSTTN